MENKLRNHTYIANSHPPSNPLAMHKDSLTISKIKPKIRIIHIFAPEIIKTDVENFRELVQKLTGKPSGEKKYCCKKKATRVEGREQESRSTSSGSGISEEGPRMMTMKKELRIGEFLGLDPTRERVKEEVGGAGSSSDESITCGGYLGGFSDLEGFISEINGGFPLLPLDGTHMQGFEQQQLL